MAETNKNVTPEEDVGIFIDPRKRAIVCIALFIAVFGCNFSFRSYSVALPKIVENWTYSSNLYSAGNSLMTVAMTVVTLIIARVSAKAGLKKTILAGLVIVLACDVLTTIAPNIIIFLVIRVFYGIGCGLICGQELSSLNLIWPSADRKKWVGFRGVTNSITNVIGPTVAGFLVDHFGWRSTFFTIFAFHLIGLIISVVLHAPVDVIQIQRIHFSKKYHQLPQFFFPRFSYVRTQEQLHGRFDHTVHIRVY